MMTHDIYIIAISADAEQFKNERILDESWAKKFPGALWIPILAKKLREEKFTITTADVALSHVKQGYWDSKKIGVIQHLNDPASEELIRSGATPLILTAFESPLYVPEFYNTVGLIAPKFSHRVMFSGLFEPFNGAYGSNHPVRFPSFNKKDLSNITSWDKREFMVMVVENKYGIAFSPLNLLHPWDILKLLKRSLWYLKSPDNLKSLLAFHTVKGQQLHDQRLSAIIYFAKKKCLKLYGKGWENLKNLPHYYSNQLKPLFKEIPPEYSENKIETIKKFKFALCFENFSFPGYITEKIIDCFVAGVIPIYLGTPDIENFIPSGCFIDVRQYPSWESLLNKLKNLTEKEAQKTIENGRKFLTSPTGQMHTFEGFASFLESLVLQQCPSPLTFANEKENVTRTI